VAGEDLDRRGDAAGVHQAEAAEQQPAGGDKRDREETGLRRPAAASSSALGRQGEQPALAMVGRRLRRHGTQVAISPPGAASGQMPLRSHDLPGRRAIGPSEFLSARAGPGGVAPDLGDVVNVNHQGRN
jgi:hypothetical protein